MIKYFFGLSSYLTKKKVCRRYKYAVHVGRCSCEASSVCLVANTVGTCRQSSVTTPDTKLHDNPYGLTVAVPCRWTDAGLWRSYQSLFVGRDSSDIATRYGQDGPGIESRWGRDFPHKSRPALGPTQTPVQWVLGLCTGVKLPGRGVDHSPHLEPRSKKEWSYTSTPPLVLRVLLQGKFNYSLFVTALRNAPKKKTDVCRCVLSDGRTDSSGYLHVTNGRC
jgi:hypothetical protein